MPRKIEDIKEDPQVYPLSWQRSTNPNSFLAAEWDWAHLEIYLKALEAEQKLWEEIMAHTASTAMQVREAMTEIAMFRGERRMYLDPKSGRTNYPPAMFAGHLGIRTLTSYLSDKEKLTDENIPSDIEVIQEFLRGADKSLEGIYNMTFSGKRSQDFGASHGWRNLGEKTNFMLALDRLLSEEEAFKTLYLEKGGSPESFKSDWQARTTEIEKWRVTFQEQEFNQNIDRRQTEGEALAGLRDWNIQGSANELTKVAEKDIRRLRRLLKKLKVGESEEKMANFTSNEEIIAEAKRIATLFKSEMIDSGIFPIGERKDWGEVNFELSQKGALPFCAACDHQGNMKILEYRGSENFWNENRQHFTSIVWHELAHRYQFLFTKSREVFPHECASVAAEAVMLERINPTVLMIIDTVKKSVLRALQFVISLDSAMNGEDKRKIKNRKRRYENAGCTPDQIKRFQQTIGVDPMILGQYWVAEKLFANLIKEYGSAEEAMRKWIETIGLNLPSNFVGENITPNVLLEAPTGTIAIVKQAIDPSP